MSIELPLPVKTYLEAVNTRNVAALDTCMTPDVRVNDLDDEQAADGLKAAKAWFQNNFLHNNLHVEATDTQIEGDIFAVTVKTAGDFPGSPLFFDYRFTLSEDRIHHIDISLVEPPNLATLENSIASDAKPQAETPRPPVATSMTVPKIMEALAKFDYVLPEAALNAAEAQPRAIMPLLLAELQRYVTGKPDSNENGSAFAMFAMYILAYFRDCLSSSWQVGVRGSESLCPFQTNNPLLLTE